MAPTVGDIDVVVDGRNQVSGANINNRNLLRKQSSRPYEWSGTLVKERRVGAVEPHPDVGRGTGGWVGTHP